MLLDRVISFAKRLEDPKHPLLGPNLKGLYLFGLWQTGSRYRKIAYNIVHVTTIFFVISQITELYFLRHDLNKALSNSSLTTLSVICCMKCFSFVLLQPTWCKLVKGISAEELREITIQNSRSLKIMEGYTKYSRIITYLYWMLVGSTNTILVVAPFLNYFLTSSYSDDTDANVDPYPQIMSSWFPFNTEKNPGYIVATLIQIVMSVQGAAVIAIFDTCAVAIMSFLKGQMILLKQKCMLIFENENEDYEQFLKNIKECHRHHNFLIEQYEIFDSLLSPIMFLYVLGCSMTICCSVVQLSLDETTYTQKLWVIQYTIGLVFQLFMYCWHGNDVFLESNDIDQGVYASYWWRATVQMRRQLILLAGKLNKPVYLNAGPFTCLSVPTFVSVIKGSYSFFTLFSQMQEEND
uniref:Odorant receptor n=1 Tax=Heortia vitessoides TaxID=1557813 RepID=A0A978W718_9NEOP|nr:odorant receptor 17 [Heortia vitessoides]